MFKQINFTHPLIFISNVMPATGLEISNQNSVSISNSASKDYEITIIEIKRLLCPIPHPFQ